MELLSLQDINTSEVNSTGLNKKVVAISGEIQYSLREIHQILECARFIFFPCVITLVGHCVDSELSWRWSSGKMEESVRLVIAGVIMII
jgi:hypothetical protein